MLSDIDLTDLLEGDALQFESVAFERGIDLHMDIQQEVHLKGDVMRLHRLTSTLIDNACKYADEGGRVDASPSALVATMSPPCSRATSRAMASPRP